METLHKIKVGKRATWNRARIAVLCCVAPLCLLQAHAQSPAPAGKPTGYLHVTDETGRAIAVPQPVRRIVSLAPNLTETLFAIGAGNLIVGDTDYCDYPPEAKAKAHVGGPVNPSLERVAALHPDLVVATAVNRRETVVSLENLGIAVYGADPRTVDQVLTSIERLAALIGVSATAQQVTSDLRRRLADISQRLAEAQPKTVLFVTWEDPLITVGSDTFLADALRIAGARSVIEMKQDWPNVSLEEVARLQPEYLIFATDEPKQFERDLRELQGRAGWRDLDALKNGRVVLLPESIDRPAPRLVDAIEQLARTLHPDRFATIGGAL